MSLSDLDQKRLDAWRLLRQSIEGAIANGDKKLSVELEPLEWWLVIEEVENRNPRNMSQLLRDDMFDQMRDVIGRLHREYVYALAHGPGNISRRV